MFEEVLAHRQEWQEGATEVVPAFEVKLEGGGWSLQLLKVCQDDQKSQFSCHDVGAATEQFCRQHFATASAHFNISRYG